MLKKNYYCLVAGLPDILIDEAKSVVSKDEFKEELEMQLSPSDFKLMQMIYLKYDNENLLNLIQNKDKPFNKLGNYSQEHLEEQINKPIEIVAYMEQFILDFKNEQENNKISELDYENKLQSLYFIHILKTKNQFLQQWFKFEVYLKNILTAVNCRKYDFDLEKQLIQIKEEDDIYDNLIKHPPKADFLSDEIFQADKIIQIAESEDTITQKEKQIDLIKWAFLDEYTFFNYFTIEKIIGFVIKLNMVHRWNKLDNETGKKLFKKLINELQNSIK